MNKRILSLILLISITGALSAKGSLFEDLGGLLTEVTKKTGSETTVDSGTKLDIKPLFKMIGLEGAASLITPLLEKPIKTPEELDDIAESAGALALLGLGKYIPLAKAVFELKYLWDINVSEDNKKIFTPYINKLIAAAGKENITKIIDEAIKNNDFTPVLKSLIPTLKPSLKDIFEKMLEDAQYLIPPLKGIANKMMENSKYIKNALPLFLK